MRKLIVLFALSTALTACGFFKRGGEPPAHRPPNTTSIYGDWVLTSPVDSTAFAGATAVELNLSQTSFTINATYPGRASQRIMGSVAEGEGGILTLIPQSGSTDATYARRSMAFVPGQPIQLIASAAGGSLLFKPPQATDPTPSSIWAKRSMAEKAGMIGKDSVKP
jgi:hypothetical protein